MKTGQCRSCQTTLLAPFLDEQNEPDKERRKLRALLVSIHLPTGELEVKCPKCRATGRIGLKVSTSKE